MQNSSDIGARQLQPASRGLMPTENCAHPITKDLLPTLLKCHEYRTPPMHGVWEPLRAWFALEGPHIFDRRWIPR
jgi:hypothetical protein